MGQDVSFIDVQFKTILVNSTPASQIAKDAAGNWVAIDANGDGEIQLTEAASIKHLNIPGNGNVTSVVGIKSFVNAEEIHVDFLDWIDALDLSNMPNLKVLSALDNQFLTTFNVSGSTALESVSVSGTDVSTINLSGLPVLQNVAVYNNSTTSVLFTGSNAITNLNLGNNALTSVDLQQFPLLETVELIGNNLTV